MFRTVRPIWTSANKLGLAGRAPHVRQAQLQIQGRFPSSKLQANRTTPLISRIAYSSKTPLQPSPQEIKEQEKKLAQKPLEARPDEVSSQSTVRPLLEPSQAPKSQGEEDFLKGLKGDVHTFKEAFALDKVPREPYILGLAGTLPYMGTSLATLYLSWNLNTTWPTSSNFLNSILLSHESASQWLHLLEPIQVAYGAVILSFLGAIHWGLEFAEKGSAPQRTRFRYAMGVLAPVAAWPTVFMPVEFALTAQFLGFTGLYFADSRATVRGWAPQWYGTYRWVLTAVVGAAIFVSLVGRAKVGENHARLRSSELQELLARQTAGEDKGRDWAKEEEKERVRLKKEVEDKKKEEEEKKKQEAEKKKQEQEKKKGGKDKKDGDKKTSDKKTSDKKTSDKEDKPKNEDDEGSMGGKEKENKDKDARKDAEGHVGGGENNEEVGQTESGEGKRKSEKGKKE